MTITREIDKFYYFFPQSVAIVGVRNNIMPAAWHTPISAIPPLYGVSISPKRYTFELLRQEKQFTVCFLEYKNAALIAQTGGVSGKDIDKLSKFGITYSPAKEVNGPILDDGYAAYECVHYDAHEYGDHYLFVGTIILLHYRRETVTEGQLVDVNRVSPALYFGKDRYITIKPTSLKVHRR